jgi:peroxiredoxin
MSTPKVGGTEPRGGRNPLLLLAGFALLGLSAALLLFGGSLFNRSGAPATGGQAAVLPQIPAFPSVQPGVNPLAGGELLQVGDMARDFSVSGLDGQTTSLSDYRGRPVILNFWATWCAPCRVEMPELQATYLKHQEQGLAILALDYDEPPDLVRSFFYDEMGLTFTPLLDAGGSVAAAYGVFNFPSTFFIDTEGAIAAVHRGPLAQQQIDGYLADILPPGNDE